MKIINKTVGKKEIVDFSTLWLNSYGIKCDKKQELIPIFNAFIFAINEMLKNNINVTIRGFGTFTVYKPKTQIIKLNGNEYKTKERKVKFKYTNPAFFKLLEEKEER